MKNYKAIVRLVILVLTLVSAALLNSKPAAAVTCQGMCTIEYSDCLATCHGNGTCAALCGDGYQSCLKGCN
jgi:dolichol kinase